MMHRVVIDKRASDFLSKLEPLVSKRITKLIREFSENPDSKEIKKLKGEHAFRLRAGDYRIIFEFDIDHGNKTIKILKIGHRKNIYDR